MQPFLSVTLIKLNAYFLVEVNKNLEEHPELAESPAVGHVLKASPAVVSEGTSDLGDYDKLQLSKENMLVDTYALIKVFTGKGEWATLIVVIVNMQPHLSG